MALHFTATQAIQHPGNYWHMLPQYGQARKVVWNAINPNTGKRRIDEAFPPAIRKLKREQEMMVELPNGSIWQLVGSDNYDAIVGAPPRGIVLSEWSLANPMAWAYLAPILEENAGWALFIFTSRGNNHARKTYDHAIKTPGWYAEKCSAEQTGVFSKEQLDMIHAEYIQIFGPDMGEALFAQEYLCSWEGAILGAYLSKEIHQARKEGRITNVPHRPELEVDTSWDLGIDDSMSIWFFQVVGQQINVIDYYEARGYGLAHYAKVLKERGYTYGNHWMPHDAEQREMTNSEVAQSRREIAEHLGIKPIQTVARARNMDAIMQVHIPAMRNMLARCVFDETRCSGGLSCLENYSAEYDKDKKILGSRPVHNWAIHGADAFRTFAVGWAPTVPPVEITIPRMDLQYREYGWMA